MILSKTGITNVPTSAITGNIGTSPITGASIAGLDCVEVTGLLYTVDATGPACRTTDATLLTAAVSDMEAAYTNAAGVPAGVGPFLNVGAGDVSGQTLFPGTYTWGSNVTIPTDLMLDAQGDANAVWIFQITGTLDLAANKNVLLSGGAQTKNIFWQVADTVTLGAGSHFEGTILAQTNIAMITGATLNGRMLAQTAVTLQSNVVSDPGTVVVLPILPPPGTVVLLPIQPLQGTVVVQQILPQTSVQTFGSGGSSELGGVSFPLIVSPIPFSNSPRSRQVLGVAIQRNFNRNLALGSRGQVLGVAIKRNFNRNLALGSRGDDVKELQNRLHAAGVYRSVVTGYFGPITKRALRSFQSQNKLPSTGFFGPMTKALLNT